MWHYVCVMGYVFGTSHVSRGSGGYVSTLLAPNIVECGSQNMFSTIDTGANKRAITVRSLL